MNPLKLSRRVLVNGRKLRGYRGRARATDLAILLQDAAAPQVQVHIAKNSVPAAKALGHSEGFKRTFKLKRRFSIIRHDPHHGDLELTEAAASALSGINAQALQTANFAIARSHVVDKTSAQLEEERQKRLQAIDLIFGLWKDRPDAPKDGLALQEELRSEW